MKPNNPIAIRKLTGSVLFASALLASCNHPATAFTAADSNTVVDAYLKAFVRPAGPNGTFIKGDQNGGDPGFWQQIEEIEGIEDANDRSGGAYKTQVESLLNGFTNVHGKTWGDNIYNDDIAWGVIAFTRGYEATGNEAFRAIAKENFDLMYARAWNPEKKALWWTTKNTSFNSCIECPAGIAAYFLSKALKDDTYKTKAQAFYDWNKANLFDAKTGAVWDAINTKDKISTWSSTYNQGTFVGLAHFLGDNETAKLAADYTMNNLGKKNAEGYTIMPEYGAGGGNNAGLNSIGLRWISRFMRDQKLEDTYMKWLQANAAAAWNNRRKTDNLAWCQWLQPTPEGNLHSWDCINAVVALQVANPE